MRPSTVPMKLPADGPPGLRVVTSGYVQINVERLRDPTQRVTDRLKPLCQMTDIPT